MTNETNEMNETEDVTEAQASGMEHFTSIERKIEELQKVAESLIADLTVEPKNWAITGSLAHISSDLDDILEGFPGADDDSDNDACGHCGSAINTVFDDGQNGKICQDCDDNRR